MVSAVLRRPLPASLQSVPVYDETARQIAELYESTTFEQVHAGTLDMLPMPGSSVLDIGAGSGRDAAALAARGYRVTAVEPSRGLREEAQHRHGGAAIEWLDDALPDLGTLGDRRFAYILVSAVWMHLAPNDRPTAMRRLAQLLEPHGRLVISIRLGPIDPSRAILMVTTPEVEATAIQSDLRVVRRLDAMDALGRADVAWATLVLERPTQ